MVRPASVVRLEPVFLGEPNFANLHGVSAKVAEVVLTTCPVMRIVDTNGGTSLTIEKGVGFCVIAHATATFPMTGRANHSGCGRATLPDTVRA